MTRATGACRGGKARSRTKVSTIRKMLTLLLAPLLAKPHHSGALQCMGRCR